ncbi:MAG: hypothetical protein FWC97_08705 [Treponema sp.]|nr:hypothetical protein [Treponema sp.]
MKKALIFLVLVISVNYAIYPITSEAWLHFGPEFGNFFERSSNQEINPNSYTGLLGLNFGGYRFFNENNFGIHIHGFFAVPIISSIHNNFDNHDFRFHVGLTYGLGFRHKLTEILTFRSAIGLNSSFSIMDYRDYLLLHGNVLYETMRFDLGVGGDLGLKFDLTDRFFLSIGSVLTFDFLRLLVMDVLYTDVSFEERTVGRIEGFRKFGVRPYITVGFNIFREYDSRGRRIRTPVANDD